MTTGMEQPLILASDPAAALAFALLLMEVSSERRRLPMEDPRSSGEPFIGDGCIVFYLTIKHLSDFRDIDIPGIIKNASQSQSLIKIIFRTVIETVILFLDLSVF